MSPLVTVTIPLYNHAKYIRATIESILNQTFQDFEIVIVDDCSSDNSFEIVKEFTDPRIRLFKNDFNGGPGFTTNFALKNSSPHSRFVILSTSDDLMKPRRIEKQVKFLKENPGFGAVFSQVEMIDERGEILSKKTQRYKNVFIAPNYSREEWLRHFFTKGNCLAAPTGAIRKDIINKLQLTYGYVFNPAIYQAQDFDIFARICLLGYNLKTLEEELISLRKRDFQKNLSSNTAEVRTRLLFENEQIISQYLQLDLASFTKIFPQAQIPSDFIFNHTTLSFLLAREALKIESLPYLTNFAIKALYDILRFEESIRLLQQQFNFSIKDFATIMAKYPLGILEEKTRKKSFFKKLFKK